MRFLSVEKLCTLEKKINRFPILQFHICLLGLGVSLAYCFLLDISHSYGSLACYLSRMCGIDCIVGTPCSPNYMADQQLHEGSSTSYVSGRNSESTVELNIKTLDSRIYAFQVDKNVNTCYILFWFFS